MASRRVFIERVLRNVYGEQPSQDSSMTYNLVNTYMQVGIGIATRNAYRDSIQTDGIAYLNNSFYTTFKGITFSNDEKFLYKATLPEIPKALGKNEGIASINIKSTDGSLSYDLIPMNANQVGYYRSMTPFPKQILYYSEGIFIYAWTVIQLNVGFTANIRMASGGDFTNLDSELNIPSDYEATVFDYCVEKLRLERNTPKDITSDGNEN
jgi:hypothetical protein